MLIRTCLLKCALDCTALELNKHIQTKSVCDRSSVFTVNETNDLAKTDEALAHGLRESCHPGSVVLQIAPAGGGTFGVLHFPVLYAPSKFVSAMVKPVERESLLFRLGVESDESAPLAAAAALPEE